MTNAVSKKPTCAWPKAPVLRTWRRLKESARRLPSSWIPVPFALVNRSLVCSAPATSTGRTGPRRGTSAVVETRSVVVPAPIWVTEWSESAKVRNCGRRTVPLSRVSCPATSSCRHHGVEA